MNILIPMAGSGQIFLGAEHPFPLPLIEVSGTTIIERVISGLKSISSDVRFIFILNEADCNKFHLDSTLKVLLNGDVEVIKIENSTKGALCSALLAADFINDREELLICNADQIISADIGQILTPLKQYDAGVVLVDSVHPRYSYVEIQDDLIVGTSVKDPISRDAIAGIYYFSEGSRFFSEAEKVLQKGADVGGSYYVASVINEYILDGGKVGFKYLDSGDYYPFYTSKKLAEYEAVIAQLPRS